jgi:hypothetical protein
MRRTARSALACLSTRARHSSTCTCTQATSAYAKDEHACCDVRFDAVRKAKTEQQILLQSSQFLHRMCECDAVQLSAHCECDAVQLSAHCECDAVVQLSAHCV